MNIFLGLAGVLMFLILLPLAWAGMSYAPWVPTRKKDLARIAALAALKPHETFYELGCGNGRVVLFMQQKTRAHCIGIERAWPLYVISFLRARLKRAPRPKIILGDMFKQNLKDANVIFTFGMPSPLREKLAPQLISQCAPGTRIISYAFRIKQWQPTSVDKPDAHSLSIYRYTL